MARAVQINPRVLSWARETAGFGPEEAAVKLDLRSTAKATAVEKLLQAESGERRIGQGVLENVAAIYRRPLVTFYLPHPPTRGARGEEFRTIAGAVSPREKAVFDTLIRDIRARQQLRETLIEEVPSHDILCRGKRMREGQLTSMPSGTRNKMYCLPRVLPDLPKSSRARRDDACAVVASDAN